MKPRSLARRLGARIIRSIPIVRRQFLTSTDYRVLSGLDEARRISTASEGWFAARTVQRQERAYLNLIQAMKRGAARLDFAVAAAAVEETKLAAPTVLEVGCGSGYYSEIFAHLLPDRLRYSGVDYSEAMIARARARYPSVTFEVADATMLPFSSGSFEIVFNGVSLLHILAYQDAVREAARVASRFCILHTVPVHQHRTIFLTKYAYGAPVVEIVFEKRELIELCENAGLRLQREWPCIPYDLHEITGHHSTTETYLFSKRTASTAIR
ncbi:class I SAM-dependent methyltransferase [Bradyrhizobium sp. CCBAU 11434]|uniref:class I SAM-dependent methyltransferase n=1 Tax=Bradyrhizobium sp. CCBAU 11434 TaxID=1630885 RepID=UPI002305EBBF|nr:class I SAM-dependent methyltransferase [Bradyrhizobium sp. CCBAU 11434]